ncbi:cupin domain-containing protein [Mesorhizobium sp. M1E.F.Ca.ET.045.02.1.1]|nr:MULTISPECIES: quercetin 2,3-dioxygenase [unclassified Mesorhizobium]AZO23301.1 cupin domain-containing protein [Mesorhizobium sp. M1E.F.Ca.ET.045.02.1.1]RUW22908.1 cupin domain-containing protein [Mesorhizobium sp. M1E.F.Ca.ET.041.01.1.1]RUW79984.1 cupin domain-containing protein [Mesorhizobium sp. M1E.F.Ca.ET.063.01.1.1]RWD85016.1 MAG: cupin domain-containing protein [Mesorhizobium sp.]
MAAASVPYNVQWLGTTYRICLTAEQTVSRLGIFESLSQPGYGPPRHIHDEEDETFYIQSGEVEFWMNGQTCIVGPGSVVHVPRGTEHAFRVLDDRPARMLTVMTPGGFEGFFAEMATHKCRIPDDMDQIAAIGARFGLTFTGPPLGAAW